jgi:glucan phosphoethanolaminetransferase (alkaline phosphatase superfamily)
MVELLVQGAVMSLAFIYWLILLLWLIFGFVWFWPRTDRAFAGFPVVGGNVIVFVLFVIIGLEMFGFPIGGR